MLEAMQQGTSGQTCANESNAKFSVGSTWQFTVDEAYVNDMMAAYGKNYRKRSGLGYFIFCLGLDAVALAGTIKCLLEGRNLLEAYGGLEALLGIYILFPGLTIFFGIMAFGPDLRLMFRRKQVVDALMSSLRADGDGTVTARADRQGISLLTGTQRICVPYALCYEVVEVGGRSFINVTNEKEQSVVYNMLGNNAYLRDYVGFSFYVPRAFADVIVQAGAKQRELLEVDDNYKRIVESFIDEGTL